VVRKVMHDFKYGRQLHLRHLLGHWLAEAMADSRLAGRRFHFIVPVPLHPARKRERGFNQAELLALELKRASRIPVHNVLRRTRYTTTQTQFDRSERMENLRGAFRLRRGCNVQGLRMLLVDDVLTTGSTLSECAAVLKKAGALSVHAATVARG
jgi:ComF family protein